MIKYTAGDLLKAPTEALVNAVNCVGVMGKGIALEFKKQFPENFVACRQACAKHELRPGKMFVFEQTTFQDTRYIINFPTKRHWGGNPTE